MGFRRLGQFKPAAKLEVFEGERKVFGRVRRSSWEKPYIHAEQIEPKGMKHGFHRATEYAVPRVEHVRAGFTRAIREPVGFRRERVTAGRPLEGGTALQPGLTAWGGGSTWKQPQEGLWYCGECGKENFAISGDGHAAFKGCSCEYKKILYVGKPWDLVKLMTLRPDKAAEWSEKLDKFCYGCKHYLTSHGQLFRCSAQYRTTGTILGVRPTTCPKKDTVGPDALAAWHVPAVEEIEEEAEEAEVDEAKREEKEQKAEIKKIRENVPVVVEEYNE